MSKLGKKLALYYGTFVCYMFGHVPVKKWGRCPRCLKRNTGLDWR